MALRQVFLSVREFVFSLQGTEVHRVLILLVKVTLKAQVDAQLCRTIGSVLEYVCLSVENFRWKSI